MQNPKKKIRISLNSSSEVTPKFIKEFCSSQGILEDRLIFVKKAERNERETPLRAAILQFFIDYQKDDGTSRRRAIIIEEMDKVIADSIFEDLQRLYGDEAIVFYQNGAKAFYLGRPASCCQFEVRTLVNNQ
uniref:Piwi domain-containing protein n=1 Tax=Caenorhabditis tropicalis TaxID=1561998 RepID=A0A1I7TEY4_9PELO